ncbi:MAG: hypothetical protein JXB05_15980 [Myxococcaceae bacterium]|nr:hypothetical protein [Myxococcaceae bacterium]
MSDSKTPKQSYTVSRRQLETLVSKAGKEAVNHALIQNGNEPEAFRDYSISRPQLAKLIEKAGKEAVDHALIQNGNEPEAFSAKK